MDSMLLLKSAPDSAVIEVLATSAAIEPTSSTRKECGVRAVRRRIRLGDTFVEEGRTTSQLTLGTSSAKVVVVVPRIGAARIRSESANLSVIFGGAAVLAGDESSVIEWNEGADGFVISIPRSRLQAMVSEILKTPRRLGSVFASFAVEHGSGSLGDAISHAVRHINEESECKPPKAGLIETRLIEAVARALIKLDIRSESFPVAGSVMRAIDFIQRNVGGPFRPEEIARAGGVTSATMRKNFRACLGLSVSEFIQNARLDRARDQLMSTTESRPIRELAVDAGYSCTQVFSRAYRRRFSESPTQTRACAVRTVT